ncbi:MAG: hypothetical protein HZB99_00150 [Candidatus Harrisonbacteria bacterium]|nr:hypothetical protein [Candidatus Harrisonbacteria bacterium]
MTRLMDVSPFGKRPEEMPMEEAQKESMMGRFKNMCLSCCPSTSTGWVVLLVALVLLWKLGVSYSLLPSLTFPSVDSSRRQAVFLTNGQVYFGHLKEANRDYAVLMDIYYLRVSQQLQPPSQQPQTRIDLVKLGNEIHAPEDTMYVPKSQIIFWENMRADSPVVQAIDQLKNAPAEQQQQPKQ